MIVLYEILLFWIFLITGKLIDRLVSKLSNPNKESILYSFTIINLQIAIIVTSAILISKYSPNSNTKKVPGVGILYAFAFLTSQGEFQKRIKNISSLI